MSKITDLFLNISVKNKIIHIEHEGWGAKNLLRILLKTKQLIGFDRGGYPSKVGIFLIRGLNKCFESSRALAYRPRRKPLKLLPCFESLVKKW